MVSFDSSTKHCHQARSARNPELKRIGAKLRSPGVFDYLVREVDQSCGEGMNSLSGQAQRIDPLLGKLRELTHYWASSGN